VIEDNSLALLELLEEDVTMLYDCWKDDVTQRGFNFRFDIDEKEFTDKFLENYPLNVSVFSKKLKCIVGNIRLSKDGMNDLAIWIYPEYRNSGF